MDYIIAIKSYKRYDLIRKRTLSSLIKMGVNLKEKVVLFVANEEERKLYEESLAGSYELKDIVVARLGFVQVCNFITDYYMDTPDKLVFQFDDDLEFDGVFHPPYTNKQTPESEVNFEKYVKFAYDKLKEYGLTTVLFSNAANLFQKKDYWAAIRPKSLESQAWGGFPRDYHKVPEWVTHGVDVSRSSQVHEREGAILYFNGFILGDAKGYGVRPGGMQAIGGRTPEMTHRTYKEIEGMQNWYKPPAPSGSNKDMWTVAFKPWPSLRKSFPDKVKYVEFTQPFGEANVKHYPS